MFRYLITAILLLTVSLKGNPEKRFNFLSNIGYSECKELEKVDYSRLSHYAFKEVVHKPIRSLKGDKLKCEYYKSIGLIKMFPDGDIEKGLLRGFSPIKDVYKLCAFWDSVNNKTIVEIIEQGRLLYRKEQQLRIADIQLDMEEFILKRTKLSNGPERDEIDEKIENCRSYIEGVLSEPFIDELDMKQIRRMGYIK